MKALEITLATLVALAWPFWPGIYAVSYLIFERLTHFGGLGDYDTGQMAIISLELAERPWPRRAPAAEPDWTAEALLRATAPRLYRSHDAYWRDRWMEFYRRSAVQTALANQHRRECGLPMRPVEPPLAVAA